MTAEGMPGPAAVRVEAPDGDRAGRQPRYKLRNLNDSIHGDYLLEEYFFQIVDTPHFQRLRGLKQLGVTSYVFPSAAHTRFEHSLGVGHLTRTLVDRLWATQPEAFAGLDFPVVRNSLIIAGLCHDLGHGPFSHLFDGNFLPRAACVRGILRARPIIRHARGNQADPMHEIGRAPGPMWAHGRHSARHQADGRPRAPAWRHEKGSVDMFDHLLGFLRLEPNAQGVVTFGRAAPAAFHPELVKAIIAGGPGGLAPAPGSLAPYTRPEVRFIFQIVANDDTGVDVDRFDYLRRDSYNAGSQVSYVAMRLVNSARIVQGQIAFPEKEFFNLRLLFQTRFSLFRQVYTHRVSEIVNLMAVDALLEADGALGISSMIHDPAAYMHLNDGILDEIAASGTRRWRCQCDARDNCADNRESRHAKGMARARALVERIRTRDLYKLAFEEVFYDHALHGSLSAHLAAIGEEALKSEILQSTADPAMDHMHVQLATIHHGARAEDPMRKVLFFGKEDPDRLLDRSGSVASDFKGPFGEYRVRVYVRNKQDKARIHQATREWFEHQRTRAQGAAPRR